jgi:hypothetical protein
LYAYILIGKSDNLGKFLDHRGRFLSLKLHERGKMRIILVTAALLFSAIASASPVYLTCSSADDETVFQLTLNEQTQSATEYYISGLGKELSRKTDGFFKSDSVTFKFESKMLGGLVEGVYTIDRTNLNYTIMTTAFGFGNPTPDESNGKCQLIEQKDRLF